MGCDIHTYLEVRRFRSEDENRENGVWINVDKWMVNEDHIMYPKDYKQRFYISSEDRIYKGRNYALFAILANVRNYSDLPSISEPKGLPKNVSLEVRRESKDWGVDGHSHSWLTLEEILSFPHWDKPQLDTTLKEFCDTFHEKTIPRMKSFVIDHPIPKWQVRTDDVRLVFWFDN